MPSKVYGLSMRQQLAPGADKVGTVWAIVKAGRPKIFVFALP